MKRVLVPVADGSEDIETSSITDVLVRCNIDVVVASVMNGRKDVTLARKLHLIAPHCIEDCTKLTFDAILLPGGMPGATHLGASQHLVQLLKAQMAAGRLYGAICAAPAVALAPNGLLEGISRATCYPGLKGNLSLCGVTWEPLPVVLCRNCLTSQGPGTAILFALTAAELLVGQEVAQQVAKAMLVDFRSMVGKL